MEAKRHLTELDLAAKPPDQLLQQRGNGRLGARFSALLEPATAITRPGRPRKGDRTVPAATFGPALPAPATACRTWLEARQNMSDIHGCGPLNSASARAMASPSPSTRPIRVSCDADAYPV